MPQRHQGQLVLPQPNPLSASPSHPPADGRLPAARRSFARRSRCLLMFAHRRAAHLRAPCARGSSRQQAPWQHFGRKRLWQAHGIRGWTRPGSSRALGLWCKSPLLHRPPCPGCRVMEDVVDHQALVLKHLGDGPSWTHTAWEGGRPTRMEQELLKANSEGSFDTPWGLEDLPKSSGLSFKQETPCSSLPAAFCRELGRMLSMLHHPFLAFTGAFLYF